MSENLQKPEVSDLTKTMLESGLVDEHMAQLMERWGSLPEGAHQYVNNDAIKDVTRAQLVKLADEIGDQVEKHRTLRETMFDLDRMKWPQEINVAAMKMTALVDRLGRYYLRVQDVAKMAPERFIPGKYIYYDTPLTPDPGALDLSYPPLILRQRVIQEITPLYIGEQVAAIQVSCGPEEKFIRPD